MNIVVLPQSRHDTRSQLNIRTNKTKQCLHAENAMEVYDLYVYV